MYKVGDRIRMLVPSRASKMFPQLIGEVLEIKDIYGGGRPGNARFLVINHMKVEGLYEDHVTMAHGPCPMEVS